MEFISLFVMCYIRVGRAKISINRKLVSTMAFLEIKKVNGDQIEISIGDDITTFVELRDDYDKDYS